MSVLTIVLAAIVFTDVTDASGIRFRHQTGATGEKYMTETMGSGLAFFDYDEDGDPDLVFINGGDPTGRRQSRTSAATLYRNDGSGTFEDVTLSAGLSRVGYGMGVTAADYDNDGDVDLYVTHYGPNVLFRNNGDGTFTDLTDRAGVGNALWSASATWLDADGDGFLDLYVTSYVDWSLENDPECSQRVGAETVRAYCLPDAFRGLPDELYRNRGDGSFEAAGATAGIALPSGKGLGVTTFDYDDDGLTDIYVANDTTPNFLFRNLGGLKFEEVGLLAGVAYDADGNALAGMGVDRADFDRDSDLDLFVTNFEGESNTLYRNEANGFFSDVTMRKDLGRPSLRRLGFGVVFADFDDDGFPDLFIANGHVLDNVAILHGGDYAQANQLFENLGGDRFQVAEMPAARVSRGAAAADVDSDFDLDVAISSSGDWAELLRNDTGTGHGAAIRLVGRKSNRDGIGVRLDVEGARLETKAASSYLSQNDAVLHVGLGDHDVLDTVTLRWPSGLEETRGPLRAGERVVWVEGVP